MKHQQWSSARVLEAWSTWAKRSVVDDYAIAEDHVVVNPPGVDLSFWVPGPAPAPGRRPLRVLFVGGDFRRKGGDLLLAWHQHNEVDGVELDVVTREDVPSAPGLRVHHGVTANSPQLRQLYQQADVFVLPSGSECFGIATLEAMATGLPVVVTDVGGTADIVEPGENGFIVPAGDVSALSTALDTILRDGDLRAAMGKRSRQLAEERFDVERNARRTIGLLKQIADDGRAVR
jgi:glycosyltransferase involved in cell wall biosynthesis